MYLCEKRQDEFHRRKPHLDLTSTRYARVINSMETELKKERNVAYETFQLLARKQHIGESLEQFYFVLSSLAARCNLGALENRILREVLSVNRNSREAQYKFCRSTKNPKEVYRIALSYEHRHKYVKTYVSTNDIEEHYWWRSILDQNGTGKGQSGAAIGTVDNADVDRNEDHRKSEEECNKVTKKC